MGFRIEKHDGSRVIGGRKGKFTRCDLIWLDGPGDFHEAIQAGKWTGYAGGGWAGASATEAFRKGSEGDPQYVPLVESIMDKVDGHLADVNTGAVELEQAVVGIIPDVPSAIMNLPESMITLEETMNDRAPITIWVNTTISGGFGGEAIANRGAAITALLIKLQAVRPVRLVGVTCYGAQSAYTLYPFHHTPMNMAQIAYCLCEAGWTRQQYPYFEKYHGGNGSWPEIFSAFGFGKVGSAEYHRHMIELFGGDVNHDVYVPEMFLHDELTTNPAKWVAERLKHYMKDANAGD